MKLSHGQDQGRGTVSVMVYRVVCDARREGLDGVTEVRVDYGAKTARITATDDRVPDRVVEATARVGFRATPGSEK